jgi:hypothetical protein
MADQASRSGVSSESMEELQGGQPQKASADSLSGDVDSVTKSTDPLSYSSVEERSMGIVN